MHTIKTFILVLVSLVTLAVVPVAADVGAAAAEAPRDWSQETVFQHVIALAQERAGQAYSEPGGGIPPALAQMDYSQYRDIRFRPESALWRDQTLFEVQLFHPGFLYKQGVKLHILEQGQLETLDFDPAMFRYDGRAAPLQDAARNANLGFAGFRLHYPLNTREYKDEVLVFLGASYFRLVGRDQVYGLSSRGLAVDTAAPSGEEFPVFREFWLVKPEADATRMTLFALLDSPSVSGAYRFDINPQGSTRVDVDARLFARKAVNKLGVAPLTSMFLYGTNSVRRHDDFRPQVHDSDGLLKHSASGEWIWRPLTNPVRLRVTSLRDKQPRGFGLLQRDRNFDHYLDMEAHYQRRPSQWVEFGEGDWGEGGVELVEIPSDSEVNDNIVAYWVPQQPFLAGEERRYQYQLATFGSRLARQNLAEVLRTRSGWAAVPGEPNPPPRSHRRFIVDFRGGELSGLAGDQPLEPNLQTSAGEIRDLHVMRLPDGETWRASFMLRPQGGAAADMRLFLSLRGNKVSEAWTYVWYPDEL